MGRVLIEAASKGDANKVKQLLKSGTEVDVRDESGTTALMEAAKHGHLDTVKLLLDSGADVNARNRSESTALMRAALSGHLDIVSILLDAGADPHVKGKNGKTPLSFAAMFGHLEVVRRLLAYAITKSDEPVMELQTDDSGNSPLILAARMGRTQVVEALLGCEDWQRGRADLQDDVVGRNKPLHRNLLASQLRVHNHYGDTALIEATRQRHYEIVRVLIEQGAEINSRNIVGRTALMVAASEGSAELTRFLLKHGADRNLTDKRGNTALVLAKRNGHADVVKLLRPIYVLNSGLLKNILWRIVGSGALGVMAPARREVIERDGDMTIASEAGLATIRLARMASQHDSCRLYAKVRTV